MMNQRFWKQVQIKIVHILVMQKHILEVVCWGSFVPAYKSQWLNVQEFCKLIDIISLN